MGVGLTLYATAHLASREQPKPVQASATDAVSRLLIPKIGVDAPIVYEPSLREDRIQAALEHGVVHYGNTATPGATGNTVLFGHSSNDWWHEGQYKFVFVLLENLTTGDRFEVNYKGKEYNYQVTNKKIVEPTEMGALQQTKEPTATLISCWPAGTSEKRLVITAAQTKNEP